MFDVTTVINIEVIKDTQLLVNSFLGEASKTYLAVLIFLLVTTMPDLNLEKIPNLSCCM